MWFQELSQIELRQICYFMEIVEGQNNFTEAAKRIRIKQPPLSKSIQALEKFLGRNQPNSVRLFDRSKHPLKLTEAGQVFCAEVQQALLHLEQAISNVRQASQGALV